MISVKTRNYKRERNSKNLERVILFLQGRDMHWKLNGHQKSLEETPVQHQKIVFIIKPQLLDDWPNLEPQAPRQRGA